MMTNIGKCANCIHFPLCMAQKGGMNLQLASENDCWYYQPQLPEGAVVLSKEEWAGLQGKAWASTFKDAEILQLKEELIQVRKETVEKILKEILFVKGIKGWQENKQLVEFGNKIVDKIEELAKQFGVEVEE